MAHRASPDIISDGIPFGAVQIAGDGMPMILVADRGTTGGYTKLATVISADLPRLAQALPGDRVSFRAVSIEEAHRAAADEHAVLESIANAQPVVFARRRLQVRVDGAECDVTLGLAEEGPPGPATVMDIATPAGSRSATIRVEVTAVPEPQR